MNKKIFTLLVGACMVFGSSFMVKAQTDRLPYSPKTTANATNFYDVLTADTVKKLLSTDDYYYVLSVTGLANPDGAVANQFNAALTAAGARSIDSSFVLYTADTMSYLAGLRIETIAKLDTAYTFRYGESTKFGAIRRASWCVKYEQSTNVTYSRVHFTFTNLNAGRDLAVPLKDDFKEEYFNIDPADGNKIFSDTLNLFNDTMLLNQWHFSQSYLPTQLLQTGMPLYSYVNNDSVVVLVLNSTYNSDLSDSYLDYVDAVPATGSVNPDVKQRVDLGGYSVSFKVVSVRDLIMDQAGNVRTVLDADGKPVNNVLLLTMKKINRFVMNADDWNAVDVSFVPNANKLVNNGVIYKNPFTDSISAKNTNPLRAYEVNDSLYHYGYMRFAMTRKSDGAVYNNQFLYVDTAFANYGNDESLAFNWGPRRDSTKLAVGSTISGVSLGNDSIVYWGNSYKARSLKSSGKPVATEYSYSATPGPTGNYFANTVDSANFIADSVSYIYAYMKDSIMENQSKFRVVYDPFADSTFINVYQSRVRYEALEDGAANPAIVPFWWENSFWLGNIDVHKNVFIRPQDLFTRTLYGGLILPGVVKDLNAAAVDYENNVKATMVLSGENRVSDAGNTGGWDNDFEKHGLVGPKGIFMDNKDTRGFHSGMFAYANSNPTFMDRVLISTADTVSLYQKFDKGNDWSQLAHIYGWSVTDRGDHKYRDSLLYVDLQSLAGGTIVTLDQSYLKGAKGLDTKIELNYGAKCVAPPTPEPTIAQIDNDLYLIRNKRGQYLVVPIYSTCDSAYWVTPKEWEDPTRMPCYQWAVENMTNTNRQFTLTNREFPGVTFSQVSLPISTDKNPNPDIFTMALSKGQSFNTQPLYGTTTKEAYDQNPAGVSSATFVSDMEKKVPLTTSFIRLSADVKSDYLLGYTYVEPDATVVDVYAFKYLHGNAMGDNARFISWNGYDNPKDTVVYVRGRDEFDILYFDLQEMEKDHMKSVVQLELTDANTKVKDKGNYLYRDLYLDLANREHRYTTTESILFEKYGYWKEKVIDDLKPLVRQAYRLFLKDPYKWHPTIAGHYMTVGGNDNYILADKVYAARPYKGDGRVEGLFGVPHFYFRDNYFDVQGAEDDYFVLLQRLDTLTINSNNEYDYTKGGSYRDVEEYLISTFGSKLAKNVLDQMKSGHQHAAFIALVEDKDADMKMVIRGDAAQRVSAFQLYIDDDPIYRRFHVNEPNEEFRTFMKDNPDTLVFHKLNEGDNGGFRLYENSGSYASEPDAFGIYGPTGGRYYNKVNGEYQKDTLGHVISFLGINEKAQYGKYTNYSIYVDTAYINRGTGWIKPQYMLVVDPYKTEEEDVCDPATGKFIGANPEYIVGRYLFNTAMYAKEVGDQTLNYNIVQQVDETKLRIPNGKAYTYNGKMERLAFAWAIHKGDSLYVLKGVDLEPLYTNSANDAKDVWMQLTKEYGQEGNYVNFDELWKGSLAFDPAKKAKEDTLKYNMTYHLGEGKKETRKYYTFKSVDELVAAGKTIGLHAIIALDDNTHKDWVFSFRYIERKASDFVIESETTDRDIEKGAVIRPGYGGWVKFDNGVPMITRTDAAELMPESYQAVFNVHHVSHEKEYGVDETDKQNPTDIDAIGEFTVIGGVGSVNILNAANKNVVITNVLGQMLVNKAITSENATFNVPAGVTFVSVEGKPAVKVLVK